MARMFLVDGSNYAFRQQFALPPRHTTQGFPTRVLYGFTNLLQRMLREWQPDYVVFSFDHGASFRNDLYPDYKGHRPEMPEDLRQQWSHLDELVEAFGCASVWVKGFEADDVIGTLAKRFGCEEVEVFMVTSDKDFCQLVDDHISVLDESKGTTIDHAGVIEKIGVPPDKVTDWLGLCGDASDNIPGVSKVGEKTATKLIQEWGSLEGAVEAAKAGKVKGAVGLRLVEDAENARLSKQLATISTDVPMDLTLEDLRPKGLQVAALRALFDRWEFGAVARKLLPAQEAEGPAMRWRTARGAEQAAVVAQVRAGALPAFAAAVVDEAALVPELIGVAFASSSGESVYLPLDDLFGRAAILNLLADPAVPKLGHGTKPLHRALAHEGRALAGVVGDTRLLDYVVGAHRKNHELADQALRLMTHTMGLSSRGLADEEALAARTCEAAWLTARLHDLQAPHLQEGQRFIYERLELPLIPVLAEMEGYGIRLDRDRIEEVDRDIAGRLNELEARCHELAGKTFNIRSRHELRDVLFTDLGLTPGKKVKDGWSTDSDVLEKLVDAHPLPGAVLEYRSLDKLRGTYLTKLPTYMAADGRIHSNFQQEVAATGRLSSIDPNLQNIPVRTFEGRRIRECFVPDPGHVFLSADYSQVELRVLAHFTKDPVLMAGFAGGEDIHKRTAIEVFKVPADQVTIDLRSAAKAINFGLIYGMSAFRLAGDLAIAKADAQRYMDEYFARMPAVKGWIEETKVHARAHGWVETLYGRRRLIPEIHAAAYNDRMGAEREAVNTCIQGTAADIIKLAMLRVRAALKAAGLKTRMLLQVHDELLLEVPEAEVEVARALVAEEMRAAAELVVPLVVNTATGRTWNEAHG